MVITIDCLLEIVIDSIFILIDSKLCQYSGNPITNLLVYDKGTLISFCVKYKYWLKYTNLTRNTLLIIIMYLMGYREI